MGQNGGIVGDGSRGACREVYTWARRGRIRGLPKLTWSV